MGTNIQQQNLNNRNKRENLFSDQLAGQKAKA